MTIEQTRQLGIEFERRVQTMIPETKFIDKLDTDTIYSFLNQFQRKYISTIYRSLDGVQEGTKNQTYLESILQCLIKTQQYNVQDAQSYPEIDRAYVFSLPLDFGMYLRSSSKVSKSFQLKQDGNSSSTITNNVASQTVIQKVMEDSNNKFRILRHPVVVLDKNKSITLIYDRYTEVTKLILTYYKTPTEFSILTSTPCELPMEAFEDIVTGAIDLYIDYVAGAEANKRRKQEQQSKQNKEG